LRIHPGPFAEKVEAKLRKNPLLSTAISLCLKIPVCFESHGSVPINEWGKAPDSASANPKKNRVG
jgi:hypothetical protein